MDAEALEGFEVGLDSGTSGAVGSGDGEGDGVEFHNSKMLMGVMIVNKIGEARNLSIPQEVFSGFFENGIPARLFSNFHACITEAFC